MKCKLTFFLSLLISIPFFYTALALEKQDYYFRRLNTENGLSQNTVLSILQDQTGFMWFGTKDGLNRYDVTLLKYSNMTKKIPKV